MKDLFINRKNEFEQTSEKYKDEGKMVSTLRFVFFLIAAFLIVLLLKNTLYDYAAGSFVIAIIIFGLLVNRHRKTNNQYQYFRKLSEINEDEVKKLEIDVDHMESGKEYLSESHPYVFDLDIFGEHSLFQLINRAETPKGRDLLAEELKVHFDKDKILKRQSAIRELKDQIDWRQKLQALALHNKGFSKEIFSALIDLLKLSSGFRITALKKIGLYLYWLLFVLAVYFIIAGMISFVWIFAFNFITLILLAPKLKYLTQMTNALVKANELLQAKKDMLIHLEKSDFTSEYLKETKSTFLQHDKKASREINSLRKIVDQLNNRGNMAYMILNSFLMLDFYILFKVESWKVRNNDYFEAWFDALAVFESISSFAGFAYANPEYSFPEINEEYIIKGNEIGHPLIKSNELVRNDFEINGRGAVRMITGSNMAGKSTFLRTMGINLVLAQSGAPVCAEAFSFYPCQVFSSMRTKDNLEESISTFYAELLRIRTLLNNLSKHKPTFYLLDEILKGTNSKDRHAGAEALIRQLSKSNSWGLVSTHDLELNTLSNEIDNFKNYSFHSEVKGSEIFFDYKLKEGPCEVFNAVALMKKMGIAV